MDQAKKRELLNTACEQTIETEGALPDAALNALWRHKVEQCAISLSDKVLLAILKADKCKGVSVQDLAAALWLKEWLGESEWDGTGRVSGGT